MLNIDELIKYYPEGPKHNNSWSGFLRTRKRLKFELNMYSMHSKSFWDLHRSIKCESNPYNFLA